MYKDDLYLLCLKYCKNVEDAQDNLHDGFMEIFKNIRKYAEKGSFEGWMKRIIINKAIDKYKNQREVNITINNDLMEDSFVDTDELKLPLDILLNLIQELPNQYRLVFNLYEMDDYSHKEISELLSISEGTSKSNLNRAKIALKEKIVKLSRSQIIKSSSNGN